MIRSNRVGKRNRRLCHYWNPSGFALLAKTLDHPPPAPMASVDAAHDRWSRRTGSSDRHLFQLLHPGIDVRSDERLMPLASPRIIVTLSRQAIPFFTHDRSRAAVRSPEARRDRTRQSPARHRPWRCLADCQAMPSAEAVSLQFGQRVDSVGPAPDAAAPVSGSSSSSRAPGYR